MKGFLEFMLRRKAFANAIMFVLLVGGLLTGLSIRQQLYPVQKARVVELLFEMRGATPQEMDRSVIQVVESALRGMAGIKRIEGEASEGVALVTISLLDRADAQQLLSDIQSEVARIDTLPIEAEKPVITIPQREEKALSLVIAGDQPLLWLQRTAETVRDDLRLGATDRQGLQRVELAFPSQQEISVELSEDVLRRYVITIEEVAEKIRQSSSELPGGSLFTEEADITIRTLERKDLAEHFEEVVVAGTDSGIPLKLGDIANIRDGFGESPIECWFNGKPAVQLDIYAVGKESPGSVEKIVKTYLETVAKEKFQGVELVIFENQAASYRDRLQLLLDNALLGLLLVLLILGLFLSPYVAFWVMVGIPTSLLGGLILLPLFGGTLNMLSLFAFIVTIGVVVDDAIMMGEAIHHHRSNGMKPLQAAVKGAEEMGGLIVFATMTTIIAFLPMFFVPGDMGVLFHQIPAVVVAVLLVSLLESVFILSSHITTEHSSTWLSFLAKPQEKVNARLSSFIEHRFKPVIERWMQVPHVVLASALACILVTMSGVAGGLLDFSFTPTIESDKVIAQAALPYGSPRQHSLDIADRLVDSAQTVLKEQNITSQGVFSLIGTRLEEGEVEVETLSGSHYISALVSLPKESERTLSGREFAASWQQKFGEAGELEAINFTGETNVTGGEPIALEIFHPNPKVAKAAALSLGERMRGLGGLTSVDDGVRTGKPELIFSLKEQSMEMGISAEEMAKQLRHRYHGAEAVRFIREGNEVQVIVRLDEKDRSTIESPEGVHLKNNSGELVPLPAVADITRSRSSTTIKRRDGKRIFPVTADIGFGVSDDEIEDSLEDGLVPLIEKEFPGVMIHFGGEEEENDEALGVLGQGFLIVLAVIFLLLVFRFNSYSQPIIIMITIPFSCIGAIWGHILLGHDLSIVSVIGIIAMAGVVVNDSLVLVTSCNRLLAAGLPKRQAIVEAVCSRFRPILLTSLTTFFGLVPLLMERSEQAQFLIPAAVSISFGLVFGTLITLLLVPVMLRLSF